MIDQVKLPSELIQVIASFLPMDARLVIRTCSKDMRATIRIGDGFDLIFLTIAKILSKASMQFSDSCIAIGTDTIIFCPNVGYLKNVLKAGYIPISTHTYIVTVPETPSFEDFYSKFDAFTSTISDILVTFDMRSNSKSRRIFNVFLSSTVMERSSYFQIAFTDGLMWENVYFEFSGDRSPDE